MELRQFRPFSAPPFPLNYNTIYVHFLPGFGFPVQYIVVCASLCLCTAALRMSNESVGFVIFCNQFYNDFRKAFSIPCAAGAEQNAYLVVADSPVSPGKQERKPDPVFISLHNLLFCPRCAPSFQASETWNDSGAFVNWAIAIIFLTNVRTKRPDSSERTN